MGEKSNWRYCFLCEDPCFKRLLLMMRPQAIQLHSKSIGLEAPTSKNNHRKHYYTIKANTDMIGNRNKTLLTVLST